MHSWLVQGQRLQSWHKKEQREIDLVVVCHQHGPFRTNTKCTCLQFILQTTLNKLTLYISCTLKFLCLFKRSSLKRQYKIERITGKIMDWRLGCNALFSENKGLECMLLLEKCGGENVNLKYCALRFHVVV